MHTKADIAPTLKRVLYNDKDERLVLWDLDTQKEIASLPSPMDVTDGTWSPDGKEFAIPSPSTVGAPQEMFIMNMEGAVKKTSLNQKYPFASVSTRPSWSPDGRHIAFWLQVSNIANADFKTLRQWLAVTDTTCARKGCQNSLELVNLPGKQPENSLILGLAP